MSNSSEDLIQEERHGDVATLFFNDPDHLNAMTQAMGTAFSERIAQLATDSSLRAVVITGRGRAFSAGGDMTMLNEKAAEGQARPGLARRAIRDTMRSFYKLFLSVRELPCPAIAAINGHAIGAGLCVALACDMRFVAREAKLAVNFTKLALHPGMAATWTLPRLVGPAVAAELLYTSRTFTGDEAGAMGLANRVLPAEEVLEEARRVAGEVAACAPLAVRGVKQALARSLDVSIEDQLSFEASEQAACFESGDALEGLAAVQERRSPQFKGC
jgi:enoyl-CoA hydratase